MEYDLNASLPLERPDSGGAEAIRLVLVRSLTGVVRWTDGKPAGGAVVGALRVAEGRLVSSGLVRVDDFGEFHIDGLHPGQYIVYAHKQGLSSPTEIVSGAKPVFYPGTELPDISNTIDLRKVSDRSLSFALDETSGINIAGTIDSTFYPKGTVVTVGLAIPGSPTTPFIRTRGKVGEPFLLIGVPRGRYLVVVTTELPLSNVPVNATRLVEELTVGPTPPPILQLVIPGPSEIAGVVTLESVRNTSLGMKGTQGSATLPPPVGLKASPDRLAHSLSTTGRINELGQFVIGRIFSGESYHLSVENVPSGFYLAQIAQGDRDLTGGALRVRASNISGQIKILLKDDGGTVSGTAERNGRPFRGASVMLLPLRNDATYWVRKTVTEEQGLFSLSGIAPGDYKLLALEDDSETDNRVGDLMQKYGDRMLPINVKAGGSYSISTGIIARPQ